jgi:hypothetical protein
MRANLFVYGGFNDPWLRELRRAPAETLDRRPAPAEAHHRPFQHRRRVEDPSGRSLRE